MICYTRMRGEIAKEREGVAEKKLLVKMFGGFSASYGDEVLTFGRQRDSKFGQLFQILMKRPGQGFSKGEIHQVKQYLFTKVIFYHFLLGF